MADAKIGQVTLKNVRLSYPHLFRPGKSQKNDEGKDVPGKYGAQFLIDPATEHGKKNLAALKAAKDAVMEEQWGSKKPVLKADKLPTRKYEPPTDEEGNVDLESADPAYLNMYYVAARNSNQPQIVDINKDADKKWRRLKESDGKPYGGCYVNAIIRIWAQDNEYGKRVNCALELVQFYKHGDSFGAGPVNPEDLLGDDLMDGGDLDTLDDYGTGSSSKNAAAEEKTSSGEDDYV